MKLTKLTIDSSVIVSSLREGEPKHLICKQLMNSIKNRENIALEPYSILIEVVSALKRRTNSKDVAERTEDLLLNTDTIHFFELTKNRAVEASNIAMEIDVKGMDAIVIQIAKENKSILVTLDQEMREKAKSIVKVKTVDEFSI